MIQPHNYFLVLFTRDAFNNPIPVGQRKIEKRQYMELCDDVFKEFETGATTWVIMERRKFDIAEQKEMFDLERAIAINCFIIIDAIKK